MNRVKTILLLLAFGCALNASAQKKGSIPVEEGKIVTEYFPSEGVKSVRLDNVFLYPKVGVSGQFIKDWLNMMAWGQKAKTQRFPDHIMLGFASRSEKGCIFPDSLKFEIAFMVDGHLIRIGSVFSFNDPDVDGVCTASLITKLPFRKLIKISRAKKVELRMAELKIELTESHLKVLRSFISQIS